MNSNSQGLQVLVSRPRRHSSVGKINLGDTIHGLTGPVPYSQNKSRQKDLTATEPQGKNGNYKDSIKKVVTSYSDLRSKHIWLPILWIVLPIYCLYFLSDEGTSRDILHMFVAVSYQIDDTDMYGKGYQRSVFCVLLYVGFHSHT